MYRHWKIAPRGSWRLFEGPADIYMVRMQRRVLASARAGPDTCSARQIALFAFDLLQSLGRTLDIRWVTKGKVYTGTYCNAAGMYHIDAEHPRRADAERAPQALCSRLVKLAPRRSPWYACPPARPGLALR